MSHWICCNSCFMSPGPERHLAVTNCCHIICNVCFQRGNQGVCLICKAKCQISPLSDKSSSEVQELFTDISAVAVKYFSEISKVLQFQARHQKRLLAHYQQKTERMKENGLKMQQEMEKMSNSRLALQSNRDLQPGSQRQASSVTKVPTSPLSMSRSLSSASLADSVEINSRGLSHKPDVLSRICLRSSQQNCHIGSVPHRASSQSTMGSHSATFSATVSRDFSSGLLEPAMSPSHNVAYHRDSAWETPVFKLPSAYKYGSLSSLASPP
ncbi:probable E3 SUMO-protein ligase RNF212 isoform X4 [Megalobrama amblycephala]|uniref:probable E3 SUMO-protein ligase RNF212 isoform X4 n=1 Tax=Megalobrama amblycephala TaxID=75352 RepID=UPI0020143917|nr:probable E3 SUMO-protein ligase RNF212 isoform X4 [Megalobrama amblycephala]